LLSKWWKHRVAEGLIGLDIGSESIKLLELNTTNTPYQVENFVIANLPSGAVVAGEIKDYAAISATLKDLFKRNNFKSKSIALAIPRSSVIIKNINIDSRLNPAEIESRAWIEANHHFPDLVGEIYLDFSINPLPQDKTQFELTLVACRKEQINPYLDVLRDSGLVATVIDVNSNALERALTLLLAKKPELTTVALLNLDNHLSTFVVTHEQKLIHAHDHSYDGQRLRTQAQDYLKTVAGQTASLSDQAYYEILKNTLSAHLRHTMHFFYSSRPNINIEKLILAGDCAVTPEIATFIQQETGVETTLGDVFAEMQFAIPLKQEEAKTIAPAMMLCCGLALSVNNPTNGNKKP
jgi:type IV pilus assembly protein PilM